MLNVGDAAPDFTAPTDKAGKLTLSELRGQRVVLFFYPKDDTPGCTKECQGFRDLLGRFAEDHVAVIGISGDDVESHNRFSEKFDLKFPLIADTDLKISKAYGVWGEQEWRGKTFTGIGRQTFLVDERGMITKIYKDVDPTGHADEILSELQKP